MLNRYDIRCLYSSVAHNSNVLSRIANSSVEELNYSIQLPCIIVVLLNSDLESWVGSYEDTEIFVKWIFVQIIGDTQGRKGKLPVRGIRRSEPKYLVIRSVPVANWVPGYSSKKNKCRVFDRTLENVVAMYDNCYITNIDEIQPN